MDKAQEVNPIDTQTAFRYWAGVMFLYGKLRLGPQLLLWVWRSDTCPASSKALPPIILGIASHRPCEYVVLPRSAYDGGVLMHTKGMGHLSDGMYAVPDWAAITAAESLERDKAFSAESNGHR
jgi:hypothetical protein